MFMDASTFVAILTGEPEGPSLTRRIEKADTKVTSSIAVFEAVLGLRWKLEISIGNAILALTMFLQRARISVVEIDSGSYLIALAAFERFGKGSGHPAQLNMGDCFAYAVARQRNLRILYVGNDFVHTDLG